MAEAEAEGWVLPQAVEQLIEQICREQNQTTPGTEVRQELALLGEEAAVNLLRIIAASTIKKTLSAFIMYMIRKPKQPHSNNNHTPSPHKVPRVSPLHTPSSPSPSASAPASQSQGIDFTLLSLSLRSSSFDCKNFDVTKVNLINRIFLWVQVVQLLNPQFGRDGPRPL